MSNQAETRKEVCEKEAGGELQMGQDWRGRGLLEHVDDCFELFQADVTCVHNQNQDRMIGHLPNCDQFDPGLLLPLREHRVTVVNLRDKH